MANKIKYGRRGSEWALKYLYGAATKPNGKPSNYIISKRWLKLLEAPFEVSDECCTAMKKRPFKQFEKETKKKPIVGTMACESKLRETTWLRNGCNSFKDGTAKSAPLSFWTENDILQYIKENKLEIASVYGDIVETGKTINLLGTPIPQLKTTKLCRTGCMFCMFGCHVEKKPNRFQLMKTTHPELYNYCMKPIEDGGGVGLDQVLSFVDIEH